jgi:hypothetical protein
MPPTAEEADFDGHSLRWIVLRRCLGARASRPGRPSLTQLDPRLPTRRPGAEVHFVGRPHFERPMRPMTVVPSHEQRQLLAEPLSPEGHPDARVPSLFIVRKNRSITEMLPCLPTAP